MTTFTRTPEQISEIKQNLLRRIDEHIAKLQAEIKEAMQAKESVDILQDPTPLENSVYDLVRKYESKVTEVTAYRAKDLIELDTTKPIEKAELRPIPKKDYSPTSPSNVRAFELLRKRYIDILRAKYGETPTDTQLQIILDHKDIEDQPNPIYIFDADGISVHYQCSDGLVKITPKK